MMMVAPAAVTWSEMLNTLRSVPARLNELTSGECGGNCCVRPAPDEWSVCEIIGHMCAVESPYRARLVRISIQENPHVSAINCITGEYDPDTPVAILIDTLAMLRRDTLAFLENLEPLARGRKAVHAELGPITLRSQVEALSAHDEEHLAHIVELLKKE
jgi:DinB superfamily